MAKQIQAGHKKAKAGKKRATGSRAAKKTTEKAGATPECTPEERHRMICERAYFLAEQRGFRGDAALDDWLQAEAMVDAANISNAVEKEDRSHAI